MKFVQVRIDEDTLSAVDEAGKRLGFKRSEIVRQALTDWLRRRAIRAFEQDWIRALAAIPDDTRSVEEWTGSQAWSKRLDTI